MLDNMRLRKVWALYNKRKRTHQALWDTTPLDLSPNGFERLFVDSFYVSAGTAPQLRRDIYKDMRKRYASLPTPLQQTIEKHYANQA